MHSTIFAHQVEWFDNKGVDIHPFYGSNFTSYIVVVNDGMLTVYTLHSYDT